jgi:hypothetical protein
MKFDLQPRFGETVRCVRRDRNDRFIEATRSAISASAVVVASGLNAEPVMPSFAAPETFRGKIIHAAEYIHAKPFAGQSVLVIGLGTSGAEVALDLAEGGARTTILVRNGVHIVPHIVPRELFGIPIQVMAIIAPKYFLWRLTKRRSAAFSIWLWAIFPSMASSAQMKVFCNGSRARREFRSSMSIRFENFSRSDQGRTGVSAITGGASFSGGNSRKFAAVMFVTGYRPGYRSFLGDGDVGNCDESTPVEQGANPMIYFVGFNNSVAGLLRQISRQAAEGAGEMVRRRTQLGR